MSITSAQFAKLADYYGFDISEARQFLGQSVPIKRVTEKKTTVKPKPPAKPSEKTKKTEKTEKVIKQKRGPTGYNLFLKDYHPLAKAKLQAKLSSGEKLAAGNVIKAVAAEWKALSDSKRASWNKKASM